VDGWSGAEQAGSRTRKGEEDSHGGVVEGFRAPAGVRKSYKYDPR
jgi:hypothetical protein